MLGLLLWLTAADPVACDRVIRGATIHDGTGAPGVIGDIALRGDRIVAIGRFDVTGTPVVHDAAGHVVAPGFIDLHTHSDYPLKDKPTRANLSYAFQGVTTVVTGNCGSGPVDVGKFYRDLESGGVGGNVCHLAPHNDIRARVMGNVARAPTADELTKMRGLVEAAMRDGAWGLSTGLIYNPGTYAKTDELVELAKPAAAHGGIYASHIRDEGAGLLTAIDEAITIGRDAKLPVHISHIKVTGKANWGRSADAIARIEAARAAGQIVTADQYPYTASSTSLRAMVVPARFREGSTRDFLARLDDADTGPKLKAAIEQAIGGREGGKTLRVARYRPKPEWQGRDIAAIAEAAGKSPLEIVVEIERNGGAQMISFGMGDDDLRLFLQRPWVATASDGSSKVADDTAPHPRSYGTFPRKIGKYSLADGLIPLEKAIRVSSGLPADILKLPGRGYLKVGHFADVVVFDPKAFIDTATYDKPHQNAPGVRWLFVNGEAVIADGRATGKLAGRVLRHLPE